MVRPGEKGGVDMFGSKKESEPLQPFNLRVLTAQHVVQGTAAGDARLLFPDVVGSGMVRVELSSVTITCIDLRQPIARTCDRFVAITNHAAILVPDADPARLADWDTYKCCAEPYKGIFHIGPYLARGTLMRDARGYISNSLVGVDLHVSTVLDGPECAEFDAPFAVVSSEALLGWEPE
jgi:hypothetical protein